MTAVDQEFWAGRRVLVTGHTGFKGGWLSIWLSSLGADVTGLSDRIPTDPALCVQAGVERHVRGLRGDVGTDGVVSAAIAEHQPEIVFHLAAQSLVRASYDDPLGTFRTNVLGTANVLGAMRGSSVRAAVIVTSDKCYENRETNTRYREDDRLGGRDPYSASKACAELVTDSFRSSFAEEPDGLSAAVATARAGNVIGGGDWSTDRLLPDAARSVSVGLPLVVRNPTAIRPWQHVLDCVDGYLLLAERMWLDATLAGPWNFGPAEDGRPVSWVVEQAAASWGGALQWRVDDPSPGPREAGHLELDSERARTALGWRPRFDTATAVRRSVDWYRAVAEGEDAYDVTLAQIAAHGSERTVSR
ncbi:MAG: CDP-glucose 4,6-dehydratase [Acidimicrobiales bacterium]